MWGYIALTGEQLAAWKQVSQGFEVGEQLSQGTGAAVTRYGSNCHEMGAAVTRYGSNCHETGAAVVVWGRGALRVKVRLLLYYSQCGPFI